MLKRTAKRRAEKSVQEYETKAKTEEEDEMKKRFKEVSMGNKAYYQGKAQDIEQICPQHLPYRIGSNVQIGQNVEITFPKPPSPRSQAKKKQRHRQPTPQRLVEKRQRRKEEQEKMDVKKKQMHREKNRQRFLSRSGKRRK